MNNIADYKLVRNSMIGSELSEDKAKILAEKMGVRHLKDGELLVEEGGSDSTLYILAAGGLAVTLKDTDGTVKAVYSMKEGECAGTRAFVDQTPRKGTLHAVGAATVYTLTPADFELLLDTHPRIAFMVMRALFRVTHANLSRMNKENKELENYVTKSLGRY
ncbi:MAG: cyclic nucleotide-binding domain-containing protein [Gallionellaceae bacterium]|jgi:CRP-like cAMP-binding protein